MEEDGGRTVCVGTRSEKRMDRAATGSSSSYPAAAAVVGEGGVGGRRSLIWSLRYLVRRNGEGGGVEKNEGNVSESQGQGERKELTRGTW